MYVDLLPVVGFEATIMLLSLRRRVRFSLFTQIPTHCLAFNSTTIELELLRYGYCESPRKSKNFEWKYLKMRVLLSLVRSSFASVALPATFTFAQDKLFPINLNIFHVSEYLKMTMIIPKCPVLLGFWHLLDIFRERVREEEEEVKWKCFSSYCDLLDSHQIWVRCGVGALSCACSMWRRRGGEWRRKRSKKEKKPHKFQIRKKNSKEGKRPLDNLKSRYCHFTIHPLIHSKFNDVNKKSVSRSSLSAAALRNFKWRNSQKNSRTCVWRMVYRARENSSLCGVCVCWRTTTRFDGRKSDWIEKAFDMNHTQR